MRKPKDNLKISKIISIFGVFLLILIVLYIKYISNKKIYATDAINNNPQKVAKISNANPINLEDIIENNNNKNTVKEEIYEKQEELEYIKK